MSKRAERRHHHKRMIDKVASFNWLRPKFYHGSEEERELHIKKMAENRQICSCDMCRNPRQSRFYSGESKLTMQERRFYQDDGED